MIVPYTLIFVFLDSNLEDKQKNTYLYYTENGEVKCSLSTPGTHREGPDI
jgi:hypothetical protein